MNRITLLFVITMFTAFGAHAQTPTPTPTPTPSPTTPATPPAWLDARVRAEVAAFSGNVRLYAKNLDTGAVYSLNGDERVRTASTIKVAVMVEAFARVAEGKAKWSDELALTKEKKVGGSGILNTFDDGLRLTFRDAVTLMMVLSDNTATNLVVDVLTADAVNARMDALGLKDTRLMRRVFGGGESAEGREGREQALRPRAHQPARDGDDHGTAGARRGRQPRGLEGDA